MPRFKLTRRRGILAVILALVCASVWFSLPSLEGRTASQALLRDETADTVLGVALAPHLAQHPDKNGVLVLGNPRESFATRAALAQVAERTLDVQYYIWHGDTTGMLLLHVLRQAAERGVRVRLLIDDNGVRGIDAKLSALDTLANFEVRLFNPYVNRRVKKAGYLYDFRRLNRRMHNKSFTVDSQATVVGGRNVGDEYFGATAGVLKADLDVMLAGPIVESVSSSFDAYWASDSAYPIDRIASSISASHIDTELATVAEAPKHADARTYVDAIAQSTFVTSLEQGESKLLWSDVEMVVDSPGKTLAVDGERAFVGSFNLDPRSMHLNTEMGFVIESPNLALSIESAFDEGIPERAYEVRLGDDGELYWLKRNGANITRLDDEPGGTWLSQTAITVLRWLPIEWML